MLDIVCVYKRGRRRYEVRGESCALQSMVRM